MRAEELTQLMKKIQADFLLKDFQRCKQKMTTVYKIKGKSVVNKRYK